MTSDDHGEEYDQNNSKQQVRILDGTVIIGIVDNADVILDFRR